MKNKLDNHPILEHEYGNRDATTIPSQHHDPNRRSSTRVAHKLVSPGLRHSHCLLELCISDAFQILEREPQTASRKDAGEPGATGQGCNEVVLDEPGRSEATRILQLTITTGL